MFQSMLRSFMNEMPVRDPNESFDEWVERSDKLQKHADIRAAERNKKKEKARAKRKRTGR